MTTTAEVCPTCGRPNVPLEDAQALKHRLVRAREVFQAAREMIRSEGDIGPNERARFLNIVDLIEPRVGDPDEYSEQHVAVVEAAVVALRDKAIELRREGDICLGGLNRFLSACGLRRWSGFQPHRTQGSPWSADYPDEQDAEDEY